MTQGHCNFISMKPSVRPFGDFSSCAQLQLYLLLLATSAAVRHALESNPLLPELLTSIDKLRGPEREDALQRALGVDAKQLKNDLLGPQELSDDTRALRQLAEAVEAAVRGGKEDVLGLDWDE
jgi:hypothetical protein